MVLVWCVMQFGEGSCCRHNNKEHAIMASLRSEISKSMGWKTPVCQNSKKHFRVFLLSPSPARDRIGRMVE